MRVLITSCLLSICLALQAQLKVLHYTETSGYDHTTRTVLRQMFENMGTVCGFTVDNDSTGDAFNSLVNLQQYSVVVFSNTSGDAILNATQQANFEAYIAGGGSYLGIHAASDNYRHSTANGTNTGTWDWYAELVGASVQQAPNHVSGTPVYAMSHIGSHQSLSNVPDPWVKDEEYYYWQNGYYDSINNVPVLEVEETVSPGGTVESYDSIRPMSWYRYLAGGGKMYYTALGHQASDYTSDAEFIAHLTDAMHWLLGITGVGETQHAGSGFTWFETGQTLHILLPERRYVQTVSICDMAGRMLIETPVNNETTEVLLSCCRLRPGVYVSCVQLTNAALTARMVLNE